MVGGVDAPRTAGLETGATTAGATAAGATLARPEEPAKKHPARFGWVGLCRDSKSVPYCPVLTVSSVITLSNSAADVLSGTMVSKSVWTLSHC